MINNDKEFLAKIRDDMLQTRQRRFQLQLAKVTSVGSLIGIASILFDKLHLPLFFYTIPFVALGFDLFIMGESFTMRRMCVYINLIKKKHQDLEFHWEEFVNFNPNKFSTIGSLIITLIAATGSCLIVVLTHNGQSSWFENLYNIAWLVSVLACFITIVLIEYRVFHKGWTVPQGLENYLDSIRLTDT